MSSDVDGVCWAGTERSESAAVAATKVKRCRILWPKDIGGIAAHPDSLERLRPTKQFPNRLAPTPFKMAIDRAARRPVLAVREPPEASPLCRLGLAGLRSLTSRRSLKAIRETDRR